MEDGLLLQIYVDKK